jgi:hypothetical protein
MKRLLPAAIAVVVVLVGATAAMAVSRKDPKDVSGRLDIVRIKFTSQQQLATLTLETENAWRCRYLKPAKKTALRWLFDDGADGDNDLIGDFVCRQKKLVFELHSEDSQYEPIFATRPDKRTVKVTMPLDVPELESDTLVLAAKSRDGAAGACDQTCRDRAPNEGRMKAY